MRLLSINKEKIENTCKTEVEELLRRESEALFLTLELERKFQRLEVVRIGAGFRKCGVFVTKFIVDTVKEWDYN